MDVAVIGLGKLGSPMAAVFAAAGHDVHAVDKSEIAVAAINAGVAPIEEPGLQEMLDQCGRRIHATTDTTAAAQDSEIIFVIVPTPSISDGSFSTACVEEAMTCIGEALRHSDAYRLVVLTSTVSPGTMDATVKPLLERCSGKTCGLGFGLCYNPEFIALGSVIRDMLNPDFVLVGESDVNAGERLIEFYATLHGVGGLRRYARMNFVNAELTKLSVNCYVTSKISYANMLADLCERIPGADARVVCRAIGLDSRIGGKYLAPGTGYGGPCFPRDGRALRAAARKVGVPVMLAEATDCENSRCTERLVRFVLNSKPRRLAVLGMSYKPGTPVTEESAGLKIAEAVASCSDIEVRTHDPLAQGGSTLASCLPWADTVVITTTAPEYQHLAPSRFSDGTAIVDCWGILDPARYPHCTITVPGKGVSPDAPVNGETSF